MKKVKQNIQKLQRALINKGKIYKISTYQFYSEEQCRLITGYRITGKKSYKKKKNQALEKDIELLNTCSQMEVMKWFAEKWKEEIEQGDQKQGD